MSNKTHSIKSNINILGGYKDFDTIPMMVGNDDLQLVERTQASKRRYIKAIEETFLSYESSESGLLFKQAMASENLSINAKLRIMSLQFYTIDRLFQILFDDCFLNILDSGRVTITKHDVIAFLDEKIENSEIVVDWSRETIDTVSRKFLTILKKLDYLEGKRKKKFKGTYNGPDFLVFYHYWLAAFDDTSNVFSSKFFSLLMVTEEKYLFLMKQDEIRDSLDWQNTGNRFTVEPKLSINEYVNEL